MEDWRRGMLLSAAVEEEELPRRLIVVDSSTDAWYLVEETTTGLCGWSDRERPRIMWVKMGMALVARARLEDTWGAVRERFDLELWGQRELRTGESGILATALVGYPGMQIPMSWSRPWPRR